MLAACLCLHLWLAAISDTVYSEADWQVVSDTIYVWQLSLILYIQRLVAGS
jgi:hypothetical protein